jgi:hypothetical protein
VPNLIQTGLWRWIKGTGLERFELLQIAHEWVLRGTIITLAKIGPVEAPVEAPLEIRYEVVCDNAWHTKRADISLRDGAADRVLRVDLKDGQWHENGRTNEKITGCIDIDLQWSPATNTIPIRRLGLAVGESSGVLKAAWVRFPDLTLQLLSQEYQRTSERSYRYTSGGGSFVADITVDQDDLVVNYQGFWQRVLPEPDV